MGPHTSFNSRKMFDILLYIINLGTIYFLEAGFNSEPLCETGTRESNSDKQFHAKISQQPSSSLISPLLTYLPSVTSKNTVYTDKIFNFRHFQMEFNG